MKSQALRRLRIKKLTHLDRTMPLVDRGYLIELVAVVGSGVPRGGFGVFKPPEIPKILVESPIAQARRAGVSISFSSSLCSHTVAIY